MLSDYFDLPSLMNLETPYIPESHLVVPDLFAPYPYSVLPDDMALSYGLTTDAARQPLVDAIEAEDAGDGAAFMDRDIHELWHRHKLVGMLAMTGKLQALTAYYDVMLSFEGIFIPSHLRGQGLGRALAQHLGEVLAAFITEQFGFALSWGKGIRVFLKGYTHSEEEYRFVEKLTAPLVTIGEHAGALNIDYEIIHDIR